METGKMTEVIDAPAKLTVSLAVSSRRADGLHELRSEMVAISLADTLEIDANGHGLSVQAGPSSRADVLPRGEDNLIARALTAVERTAGVVVHKRIPVRGGLGGGSTDAAAILRWAGCDDPMVAVRLGSDVPFCVVGGRATVEGGGETVTPLEFEDRQFVLLIPPIGVDTGAVYRAWDDLGGPQDSGANDLTLAALHVEPLLVRWRDAFRDAIGGEPVLAGSGSTWFVEGPAELLEGRSSLMDGAMRADLVAVRSVAAGWRRPD